MTTRKWFIFLNGHEGTASPGLGDEPSLHDPVMRGGAR
jgi:hypothetical protein